MFWSYWFRRDERWLLGISVGSWSWMHRANPAPQTVFKNSLMFQFGTWQLQPVTSVMSGDWQAHILTQPRHLFALDKPQSHLVYHGDTSPIATPDLCRHLVTVLSVVWWQVLHFSWTEMGFNVRIRWCQDCEEIICADKHVPSPEMIMTSRITVDNGTGPHRFHKRISNFRQLKYNISLFLLFFSSSFNWDTHALLFWLCFLSFLRKHVCTIVNSCACFSRAQRGHAQRNRALSHHTTINSDVFIWYRREACLGQPKWEYRWRRRNCHRPKNTTLGKKKKTQYSFLRRVTVWDLAVLLFNNKGSIGSNLSVFFNADLLKNACRRERERERLKLNQSVGQWPITQALVTRWWRKMKVCGMMQVWLLN